MINFDEEIQKFQPSLEVEDAEDAIYNNDVPDITDLISQIVRGGHMRCYKCGSFLTDGDTCPQCGENVRIYKKTARVSDAYYNAGLYKARVRDLTGAVESLKISLMINKYNTNARNLLGLVYCEMGDVVEALSQWVVSKNLRLKTIMQDTILRRYRLTRTDLR